MNKNPDRPEDMDNILFENVNPLPQQEEEPQYKKAEKEVLKEVFGE